MLNITAIFIGGGLGAVLRYLAGMLCSNFLKINFPLATFIVNIAGCFILGFLYFLYIEKVQLPSYVKLALTVGFCGGLTTFSTFSLELFELLNSSQVLNAVLYLLLSVIIGLLAVCFGGYCAKFL